MKSDIYPLYAEKPIWPSSANSYLLKDKDGAILVDVGCGKSETYERIKEFLSSHGFLPRDVHTVVLTHAHPDHMGALTFLLSEAQPEIITHPVEKELAENPSLLNRSIDIGYVDKYYMDRLPGVSPSQIDAIEYFGFLCPMGTAKVSKTVVDGDELELAGRIFEVIHTPGHAPGHISLYEKEEGILISGDVLGSVVAWYCPSAGGAAGFLESLAKIDYLDVRLVFPSHGKETKRVSEAIEKTRGKILGRESRIIEALKESPRSILELVDRLFPVEDSKMFPGLQIVDSHLIKLENDGVITRFCEDGMLFARMS
ncbi:MAG: MBL fold metallo-hydrolase [Actinomycetota bacterium]|nr:MBL fold metallo-hydrolase [Actinomycetota bacterium]